MIKVPSPLKKGDMIGLTCPAGYMPAAKAATCISTLQQWGYEVMVGKTLGSNSNNYFSGDDAMRREELQAMLDDPGIKAILCGRGGYGVGRIIDELDFTKFKKNPKWIIGFSDITVLHSHIHSNYKIATLHAPMAAAFNDGNNTNDYVLSLQKALAGKKTKYSCAAHEFNQAGECSGQLVGGNLALIAHLIGTASDIDTKNKILFLEDIGEYIYNVDRMFYQLKRSGKLDKLSGLIIGGFTDMKDTERPFGQTTEQAIRDLIGKTGYPVCFGFPVSHNKENYALKTGVVHHLKVTKNKTTLVEI